MQKKSNGYNLTIFVDKEGGVNITDCEKLHKLINDPLDELDPTNGVSYILNVSSCGIDWPLKTKRDFEKKLNREIEIKFYKPIDGVKYHKGILVEVNDENIVIKENEKDVVIKFRDIASANLYYEEEV